MTQPALFDVVPVKGEWWDKPDSTARKHMLITDVWPHPLFDGELWVSADRPTGDFEHISTRVSQFLALGYVKIK